MHRSRPDETWYESSNMDAGGTFLGLVGVGLLCFGFLFAGLTQIHTLTTRPAAAVHNPAPPPGPPSDIVE